MPVRPLPHPLRGIVPPIVTPLCDQDQLDAKGLQRLIDRLVQGGVHALFALGTTGEAPFLDHAMRHRFLELVAEFNRGRLPILVGITDTSFVEAIELAEQAYAAGACAVVAAPPYYLPTSQLELCQAMELLADRVPLPLLLYNMPGCTKVNFCLESIERLAEHPNIVGLKDSSGDMNYFRQVAERLRPLHEFTLLVGPEELLVESLHAGGHGGVNGGANMFPELYVALYEAVNEDRCEQVALLRRIVLQISQSIYSVSSDPSRVVKGIKAGLRSLGVCDDFVAWPFEPFSRQQREGIAQHVESVSKQLRELLPEAVSVTE